MKQDTEMLINAEKAKDKPIIFRANQEDKVLLEKLCEQYKLKQSAVIRIAIRKLSKELKHV